jgi:hypothetical protein
MNPTEKFQNAVFEAVSHASKNGVHPAIVYTVLGGLQSDVLSAVKQANRMAKDAAVAETAETIVNSNNSKPANEPANVIQLPKADPID